MAKVKISQLPSASSTDYVDTTTFPATSGATNDTNKFTFAGLKDFMGGSYSVRIEIPSAEVLTLNSVPVQCGITVPAGYIPMVVGGVFMASTYNSATYAANTDLAVRSVGGSNNVVFSSSVLGFTADIFRNIQFTAPTSGLLYISGADLEVYVPSGDPTTGDSDIVIYLQYILVEL